MKQDIAYFFVSSLAGVGMFLIVIGTIVQYLAN